MALSLEYLVISALEALEGDVEGCSHATRWLSDQGQKFPADAVPHLGGSDSIRLSPTVLCTHGIFLQ